MGLEQVQVNSVKNILQCTLLIEKYSYECFNFACVQIGLSNGCITDSFRFLCSALASRVKAV